MVTVVMMMVVLDGVVVVVVMMMMVILPQETEAGSECVGLWPCDPSSVQEGTRRGRMCGS